MSYNLVVRGNALDAWLSRNGRTPYKISSGSEVAPALVSSSGMVGAFGANVIDMVASTSSRLRFLAYNGKENLGPFTVGFTAIIRFIPTWTGMPTQNQGLFGLGMSGFSQFTCNLTSAGKLSVQGLLHTGGLYLSDETAETLSCVAGTAVEIQVSWDGTSGAGKIKFSVDGVPFGVLTAPAAFDADYDEMVSVYIGSDGGAQGCQIRLDEFIFANTAMSNTYTPRTAYLNVATFDGEVDPADVREGVVYDRGDKTGTLDLPDESDVLVGVDYDGASKTGTLEPASNVITDAQELTAVAGLTVYKHKLEFTQGDDIVVQLKAMANKTDAFDLTGATLESSLHGTSGTVTIDTVDHTVDSDQVANKGVFTVRVRIAATLAFNVATLKDWITKITQGSTVRHVHGIDLVNVYSATPLD